MRRALGKGLSQLFGADLKSDEEITQAATEHPTHTATSPQRIAVTDIVPNAQQPRSRFDDEALDELAESIRSVGMIQPIIVRPIQNGTFQIVAGERRWRAARLAGLTEVDAIVRSYGSQESLEVALIENVQREDISAIECARAYQRLIDEFGLTQEDVAESVGKARATVANTLRLLRLPNDLQELLEDGTLTEGHARALLMFPTPEVQRQMAELTVDKGLSVRQLEQLAKGKLPEPTEDRPKREVDPNWQALESALQNYFGSPAKLQRKSKGGSLTISYYSDDELQRILDLLGIQLG